jgi:hypothetical protein
MIDAMLALRMGGSAMRLSLPIEAGNGAAMAG